MSFLKKFENLNRAKKCNDELRCFVSLEKLKDSDLAFAWNSNWDCSVPIHKNYNSTALRKQWLAHEKDSLKKSMVRATLLTGCSLSKEECDEYVERTFPKE